MSTQVRHNEQESRYELLLDDELVGIAEYRLKDDRLTLFHTEVEPARERRGLGGELARAALDDARARQLAVVPTCPFIAWYIAQHPEYLELVVPEMRERVKSKASGSI